MKQRKFTAWLLVIAMIITMVPVFAMPVSATATNIAILTTGGSAALRNGLTASASLTQGVPGGDEGILEITFTGTATAAGTHTITVTQTAPTGAANAVTLTPAVEPIVVTAEQLASAIGTDGKLTYAFPQPGTAGVACTNVGDSYVLGVDCDAVDPDECDHKTCAYVQAVPCDHSNNCPFTAAIVTPVAFTVAHTFVSAADAALTTEAARIINAENPILVKFDTATTNGAARATAAATSVAALLAATRNIEEPGIDVSGVTSTVTYRAAATTPTVVTEAYVITLTRGTSTVTIVIEDAADLNVTTGKIQNRTVAATLAADAAALIAATGIVVPAIEQMNNTVDAWLLNIANTIAADSTVIWQEVCVADHEGACSTETSCEMESTGLFLLSITFPAGTTTWHGGASAEAATGVEMPYELRPLGMVETTEVRAPGTARRSGTTTAANMETIVGAMVEALNEEIRTANAAITDGSAPQNEWDIASLDFAINLTYEGLELPTLVRETADGEIETMPAFEVKSFSVDGGERWRAVNARTFVARNGMLPLLNKGGTILISDAAIDRATKKPATILEPAVTAVTTCSAENCTPGHDGCELVAAKDPVFSTTVSFPAISARPKADRVVINYLPLRDLTGRTSGRWTLSARGSTTALAANALNAIEIAVPTARNGRALGEEDGWNKIAPGTNVATSGMAVMELVGARPTRHSYFIRQAPSSTGGFTPASKPSRIQASSELKALRAPRLNKQFQTNLRAGTIFSLNGATARLQADRGLSPVVPAGQTLEIWTAATDKRPASARAATAIVTRPS